MGKYSKSFFENPYLEEGENQTKYSAEVIMDEARQKWRAGSWRARSENFEFERSQLTEQTEDGEDSVQETKRPSSDRFQLDIQRDLTGDSISLKKLGELDYSASYRPKGDIEERIVGPRSTLQRYDVLAGELEAPPEDLSFVSDAEARRERDEKLGNVRSGQLRRDTRRLDTSVDERRTELIRMLPDHDDAKTKAIVKETARRRRREDAELGRTGKKKLRRRFTPEEDIPKEEREEHAEAKENNIPISSLAGTRLERLPKQTGMESSMELPEFATEARYWSQITGENPSWSEIAAHSVNTVPQDEEPTEFDGRYVRPDEDSGSEYAITATRARVRSNEAGEFKNEYIREANIDPERIKEIMGHRYRGRWIPPEFFADDALVEDYFNALSSGQTGGEDFVTWAYRRKTAEQQQRQMAERQRQMAERARREYVRALRTPHAGRRRSPFGQPPKQSRAMTREEMLRQYDKVRQQGYEQGASIKEKSRPAGYGQMGPGMGYNPYGYGMNPYAMPPQGGSGRAPGGYQGMYPELFEGTNPQPQLYYPQGYQPAPPQGMPPQPKPPQMNRPAHHPPHPVQRPVPPHMQPPNGPYGGMPPHGKKHNSGQ